MLEDKKSKLEKGSRVRIGGNNYTSSC
jgi:hypothetical protein